MTSERPGGPRPVVVGRPRGVWAGRFSRIDAGLDTAFDSGLGQDPSAVWAPRRAGESVPVFRVPIELRRVPAAPPAEVSTVTPAAESGRGPESAAVPAAPQQPGSGQPPADAALGSAVSKGLWWSLLNTVVARLGTFVSGIVLARLLVPEDYGVFAVALVTMTALLSINELGVSLSLLRWSDADARRVAPTVATLAMLNSLLLYAACFAAAPAIADALNAPDAVLLLRVLGVSVLLDAISTVPNAWMTRAFQQRRRLRVDLVAFGVSTAAALASAFAGAGAWALVAGYLAANVVTAILMVAWSPTRLRFGFSIDDARATLVFGLPLAGASLLNFAVLNIDYVIIGAVVGPVGLGFYLLAFNLSSLPANVISTAMRRVSLAGFSRMADEPGRAEAAFVSSTRLVLLATGPACAVIAGLGVPLVTTVYGTVWAPAATALQFLVVLGGMRVLLDLAYDYLVASGSSRATVVLQGIWLGVLVPVLIGAVTLDGFTGAAWGHAAVAVAVMGPAFVVSVAARGVSTRHLLRAVVRPLLATAAVGVCAIGSVRLIPNALAALVLGGLACLVVLLAIVYPIRRDIVAAVRGEATEERPVTAPAARGVAERPDAEHPDLEHPDLGHPDGRSAPSAGPAAGRVDVDQNASCESDTVGAGTRIGAFTRVVAGAVVGSRCVLSDHVHVASRAVIGDRVTIRSGVQIWDGVTIGDDVYIGANVTFTEDPFPPGIRMSELSTRSGRGFAHILVGDAAYLGAGSVIGPGVTIGHHARIEVGAVVTRDVPAGTAVTGNPARVVRDLPDARNLAGNET